MEQLEFEFMQEIRNKEARMPWEDRLADAEHRLKLCLLNEEDFHPAEVAFRKDRVSRLRSKLVSLP